MGILQMSWNCFVYIVLNTVYPSNDSEKLIDIRVSRKNSRKLTKKSDTHEQMSDLKNI